MHSQPPPQELQPLLEPIQLLSQEDILHVAINSLLVNVSAARAQDGVNIIFTEALHTLTTLLNYDQNPQKMIQIFERIATKFGRCKQGWNIAEAIGDVFNKWFENEGITSEQRNVLKTCLEKMIVIASRNSNDSCNLSKMLTDVRKIHFPDAHEVFIPATAAWHGFFDQSQVFTSHPKCASNYYKY